MGDLDFGGIERPEGNDKQGQHADWRREDANRQVQMSVRMPKHIYDRYRQLCKSERYSNGEMLEILLKAYEKDNK